MQRYLSILLFFLFSVMLLHQSAMAAQGTQPASLKNAQQGKVISPQPVAKAKIATAAPTVREKGKPQKQAVAKKKVITKAVKPVPKPNRPKPPMVAKSADPSKACGIGAATVKKQVEVVKRTVTSSAGTIRKISTRRGLAVPQRRIDTIDAEMPVDSGERRGLPDITTQISSKSFMVMDAGSGTTLFARLPDSPRQPASTIKIVTAMIALKSLKNDDVVSVSYKASGMPSSKIFLDPKQNYRANDLINAVMLASANDASVALAEKIAGTEDRFANLMTLSARIWGAQNTICRTASGLTAEGQQSTARDLANLFRYAMQHNEFAKRMHEKQIATSYGKTLLNHNKALWRVDGAEAGKTGYTVAARQTYVGQFSRGGDTIVVAIMGSETMWADLKKLVDYGFSKKKMEQLAQPSSNRASQSTARVN
ncbi:MAG: D-alanyl-D-alanine carboxypeptidase [Desulfobulbaceae bacterium]|nr:D-alanyl-D-alanine carboxypeptidase [Desulfobulbaceae bacterium]